MDNEKSLQQGNFTEGNIIGKLLRFAMPVLAALFLQAMYGAVDLLVVGQFSTSADVSAVSTGSQIMQLFTNLVSSFAMGTTVLLGQKIGEGRAEEGGRVIGASIFEFAVLGAAITLVLVFLATPICRIMNAPEEAFDATKSYVRICGAGTLVIIAYNLIGSVFRGIGDARTPLITVAIACVTNIVGDLLLVAVFHMGAAGAAIATVAAQLVSVILSLMIIRKTPLPFDFEKKYIKYESRLNRHVTRLGLPIALQDLLVGLSFLIIMAIVNRLGVVASAGVGVAEKVCAFIMLVPAAFMQSLSAFVAQNAGAGKLDRARKALYAGIGMGLVLGLAMSYLSLFHGSFLSALFAKDLEVVAASAEYLKAYAIDCILTPIFFCYIGFYNGLGKTNFVMAQGIIGAFGVRVPVSYLMSLHKPASLFRIGLATPCSSMLQIILCVGYMILLKKKGLLRIGGEEN